MYGTRPGLRIWSARRFSFCALLGSIRGGGCSRDDSPSSSSLSYLLHHIQIDKCSVAVKQIQEASVKGYISDLSQHPCLTKQTHQPKATLAVTPHVPSLLLVLLLPRIVSLLFDWVMGVLIL